MRLQVSDGADRPIEAMLELAEFQLRWRTVDATADTLDEVERSLDQHDNAFLRARADLLRGRILSAQRDDFAYDVLTQARDRFDNLDRRLFVRDAEVALARCAVEQNQREGCRRHLSAAHAIHNDIISRLPPELVEAFGQTEGRRQLAAVEALLAGRRVEFAPTAPEVRPAVPVAVRTNRTTRKPEWAGRYDHIIGESSKLYRVFHILDRIADSEGTVLINGESGTGKELIAEAIHQNSDRAGGPFVKLNCAALVESLLLSELFGHERGSFTGAHQRKIGRFEMAAGGTIFLDEIGDISMKTQVALLRVLQEREFERVGGGKPIKVDARIIFATNRNLGQMVREGAFREDLYYRLKGISIDLPPLRDRPEDIRTLAEHFLRQYAGESGSVAKSLSEPALRLLIGYPWPGNIRELENIIRSVALFAEAQVIDARDFDEYRELFNEAPMAIGPTATVSALNSGALASPSGPDVSSPVESGPLSPLSAPASAVPVSAVTASSDRTSNLGSNTARPPASAHMVEPAPGQPYASSNLGGGPSPEKTRTPEEIQADLLMEIFAQGVALPELKKRIQEQAIAQALQMTQGNITRAAELLGMRRPRLSQIINASEELKALALEVSK